MRSSRIIASTKEQDQKEQKWWDVNAAIIERIWAQDTAIQKLIRLPYLKKMKRFFRKHNKKNELLILEIGCGTGWVGRLVADDSFHILGTDFSEGQLAIATTNAEKSGLQHLCKYELADASTFSKSVDGVLIHALLHHLSTAELDIFFTEFNKLQSGTKVFIYEPVFLHSDKKAPTLIDKILNRIRTRFEQYAVKLAKSRGAEDSELNKSVENLFGEANANGWYLSPKEVPFNEDELENYISKTCEISRKYIVNRTELVIAQALTLNGHNKPDWFFSKAIIPLSILLDKVIFLGRFRQHVYPQQHLFVCYEAIKK